MEWVTMVSGERRLHVPQTMCSFGFGHWGLITVRPSTSNFVASSSINILLLPEITKSGSPQRPLIFACHEEGLLFHSQLEAHLPLGLGRAICWQASCNLCSFYLRCSVLPWGLVWRHRGWLSQGGICVCSAIGPIFACSSWSWHVWRKAFPGGEY